MESRNLEELQRQIETQLQKMAAIQQKATAFDLPADFAEAEAKLRRVQAAIQNPPAEAEQLLPLLQTNMPIYSAVVKDTLATEQALNASIKQLIDADKQNLSGFRQFYTIENYPPQTGARGEVLENLTRTTDTYDQLLKRRDLLLQKPSLNTESLSLINKTIKSYEAVLKAGQNENNEIKKPNRLATQLDSQARNDLARIATVNKLAVDLEIPKLGSDQPLIASVKRPAQNFYKEQIGILAQLADEIKNAPDDRQRKLKTEMYDARYEFVESLTKEPNSYLQQENWAYENKEGPGGTVTNVLVMPAGVKARLDALGTQPIRTAEGKYAFPSVAVEGSVAAAQPQRAIVSGSKPRAQDESIFIPDDAEILYTKMLNSLEQARPEFRATLRPYEDDLNKAITATQSAKADPAVNASEQNQNYDQLYDFLYKRSNTASHLIEVDKLIHTVPAPSAEIKAALEKESGAYIRLMHAERTPIPPANQNTVNLIRNRAEAYKLARQFRDAPTPVKDLANSLVKISEKREDRNTEQMQNVLDKHFSIVKEEFGLSSIPGTEIPHANLINRYLQSLDTYIANPTPETLGKLNNATVAMQSRTPEAAPAGPSAVELLRVDLQATLDRLTQEMLTNVDKMPIADLKKHVETLQNLERLISTDNEEKLRSVQTGLQGRSAIVTTKPDADNIQETKDKIAMLGSLPNSPINAKVTVKVTENLAALEQRHLADLAAKAASSAAAKQAYEDALREQHNRLITSIDASKASIDGIEKILTQRYKSILALQNNLASPNTGVPAIDTTFLEQTRNTNLESDLRDIANTNRALRELAIAYDNLKTSHGELLTASLQDPSPAKDGAVASANANIKTSTETIERAIISINLTPQQDLLAQPTIVTHSQAYVAAMTSITKLANDNRSAQTTSETAHTAFMGRNFLATLNAAAPAADNINLINAELPRVQTQRTTITNRNTEIENLIAQSRNARNLNQQQIKLNRSMYDLAEQRITIAHRNIVELNKLPSNPATDKIKANLQASKAQAQATLSALNASHQQLQADQRRLDTTITTATQNRDTNNANLAALTTYEGQLTTRRTAEQARPVVVPPPPPPPAPDAAIEAARKVKEDADAAFTRDRAAAVNANGIKIEDEIESRRYGVHLTENIIANYYKGKTATDIDPEDRLPRRTYRETLEEKQKQIAEANAALPLLQTRWNALITSAENSKNSHAAYEELLRKNAAEKNEAYQQARTATPATPAATLQNLRQAAQRAEEQARLAKVALQSAQDRLEILKHKNIQLEMAPRLRSIIDLNRDIASYGRGKQETDIDPENGRTYGLNLQAKYEARKEKQDELEPLKKEWNELKGASRANLEGHKNFVREAQEKVIKAQNAVTRAQRAIDETQNQLGAAAADPAETARLTAELNRQTKELTNLQAAVKPAQEEFAKANAALAATRERVESIEATQKTLDEQRHDVFNIHLKKTELVKFNHMKEVLSSHYKNFLIHYDNVAANAPYSNRDNRENDSITKAVASRKEDLIRFIATSRGLLADPALYGLSASDITKTKRQLNEAQYCLTLAYHIEENLAEAKAGTGRYSYFGSGEAVTKVPGSNEDMSFDYAKSLALNHLGLNVDPNALRQDFELASGAKVGAPTPKFTGDFINRFYPADIVGAADPTNTANPLNVIRGGVVQTSTTTNFRTTVIYNRDDVKTANISDEIVLQEAQKIVHSHLCKENIHASSGIKLRNMDMIPRKLLESIILVAIREGVSIAPRESETRANKRLFESIHTRFKGNKSIMEKADKVLFTDNDLNEAMPLQRLSQDKLADAWEQTKPVPPKPKAGRTR